MLAAVPILDDLRDAVRRDPRSQRQVAIAAGIHPNTMTAFMQGRRGLSVETAESLAGVLGRPLKLQDGGEPDGSIKPARPPKGGRK